MATPSTHPVSADERPRDHIRMAAIDKALLLYEVLSGASPAMRLSELCRRTGLAKSTVHRLLSAMVASDLVVRFGMGYAVARRLEYPVAAPTWQRELLRRLAPFVGDLRTKTGLTASLAVLEDTDVVFAHRVFSHDNAWTPSDDTGRECSYRTAAGRLLLSHDPNSACDNAETWGLTTDEAAQLVRDLVGIRHRQVAVAAQAGVTCLAVPLPAGPSRLRIAFTVKGRTRRVDLDRTLQTLRIVAHEAARAAVCSAADSSPGNASLVH